MSGPARFVIDAMLGNVARELRLLGLDALFDASLPDNELLRLARSQGRVLVTRDRALHQRAKGVRSVYVEEKAPKLQTAYVLSRLPTVAGGAAPLTRCLECNSPLERLERADALALVPDHLAWAHDDFNRCPGCGRTYWPGTHRDKLQTRAVELMRAAICRE